jgi:hypothetical protein
MAWGKNGIKTLSSNGTSIDVTGLSNNKFNQILSSMEANTSTLNPYSFINNEAGYNYATRYNINGTSESVQQGVNYGTYSGLATKANPYFIIDYLAVIGTEEKLGIRHVINQNTAGAGTAPDRAEVVYKVVNTADLSSFKWTGGDFSTDDQVVALGSDGVYTLLDGAIFYETDTNKSYVLNSGTWTEL